MTQVSLGQAVPDFEAASTGDKTLRLSELKGKNVVIYFYPKDSTPGCTTEGQNFRDNIDFFNDNDTVIFGVSRDSLRSHENFKTKQCFPFDLLSDPEEALCKHFDVIKLKKMYGKEYLGIERSTFLIDKEGNLAQEWRKVKVKGHVDEVIEAIKAL
jgi:peroxiredoxin Q/BCP